MSYRGGHYDLTTESRLWRGSIPAMCSDGNKRYVQITGCPDTFFSTPGRIKVGGENVVGFIIREDGELRFVEGKYGRGYERRGLVLPEWKAS